MKERLLRGAQMLGALWRSRVRCADGWLPVCACPAPTRFCTVKQQWAELARRCGRPIEADTNLFEVMTVPEFEAAAITVRLDNGVSVGPKGFIPLQAVAGLEENRDAIPAVLKVLATFPGARVVST